METEVQDMFVDITGKPVGRICGANADRKLQKVEEVKGESDISADGFDLRTRLTLWLWIKVVT